MKYHRETESERNAIELGTTEALARATEENINVILNPSRIEKLNPTQLSHIKPVFFQHMCLKNLQLLLNFNKHEIMTREQLQAFNLALKAMEELAPKPPAAENSNNEAPENGASSNDVVPENGAANYASPKIDRLGRALGIFGATASAGTLLGAGAATALILTGALGIAASCGVGAGVALLILLIAIAAVSFNHLAQQKHEPQYFPLSIQCQS